MGKAARNRTIRRRALEAATAAGVRHEAKSIARRIRRRRLHVKTP